jgi:DNA-binding NarL/FixJ family response regulator
MDQAPSSAIAESDSPHGNAILLIEPRALIRECLSHGLQQVCILERIIAVASINDWYEMEPEGDPPGVAILSISGRRLKPQEIQGQRSLLRRTPASTPMIIVGDDEDAATILCALDSGASGFIPTNVTTSVAIEAIRLVLAGGTYVPATALTATRAQSNGDLGSAPLERVEFTERQLAVLERLRQGRSNKAIAQDLNMRESTVKVHIRNIMRKLRATNRTEVAYIYQTLHASPDRGQK